MISFKQYIQESLNSPFKFKKIDQWDTDSSQVHRYGFKDKNGAKTHVFFSHHVIDEPSRASVDFTDDDGSYDKTGKGSIRHLSTVKAIMQHHAKQHPNLKKYTFTAIKDEVNDDYEARGRTKLYTRLTRLNKGHTEDAGHFTKHVIPINGDKK